jgi:hypothetical protein
LPHADSLHPQSQLCPLQQKEGEVLLVLEYPSIKTCAYSAFVLFAPFLNKVKMRFIQPTHARIALIMPIANRTKFATFSDPNNIIGHSHIKVK